MEWLQQDEQHVREYRRLRKLYDIALWRADESQTSSVAGKGRMRRCFMLLRRVAAVAAVLVCIWLYGYYADHVAGSENQTVYVPAGQHAELMLADGTQVWLNSGSRFTFPTRFGRRTRRVELDGEGYFKVNRCEGKPFIVNTSRCDVKVLGTEFNVLAYRNDTVWETALLKGSVEVLPKGEETFVVKLEPGTLLRLDREKLVKERIYATDYFRWREGLICFDNISLRDMLEKLKLYYDVEFAVENPQILDVHYTGKFRTRDGIEHVMRVLSLSNKFHYTKDEDRNIVTIY